jgi:outer membrane protein assembly factor BamB
MERISGEAKHRRGRSWMQIAGVVGVLILLMATVATQKSGAHASVASGSVLATFLENNGRTSFNAGETIINPNTAPKLKLHWKYKAGGAIVTQPVEANGMLYWGSWDGVEHATNLNGGQVWAINLGKTVSCGKAGVSSTATVASVMINGSLTSVVFVAGGNAHFYALNAATGAIIWQRALGTSPSYFLWSSPAVYNGSVSIGSASFGDCPLTPGQLIQMDAATGTIQHTFTDVPQGCVGGGVWGSPTIDTVTGEVYFTTGTYASCSPLETMSIAVVELHAANLSYVGSWQLPPAQRGNDSDFGTTPTLFQATIGGSLQQLVGAAKKNGKYYAFIRGKISSGPVWTDQIAISGPCPTCGAGSISSSAWDGTKLYVAGGKTTINGKACLGSLRALNPATGGFLWQHCMNDGPVLGAVSAIPGVAVVGEGPAFALTATTSGQTLFTYKDFATYSHFYGTASIINGVLYIGNMDGILYAFGT